MAVRRRGRKFWKRLFAKVEAEGSVVEVARRHGVSDRTLHWWCWKLRAERRAQAEASETPRLLPVVLRDPPIAVVPQSREIVVEWQEVRVRVPCGMDVHYVAALIGVLRAC